jgi:tetratricopeptide (TPR) repeat protein
LTAARSVLAPGWEAVDAAPCESVRGLILNDLGFHEAAIEALTDAEGHFLTCDSRAEAAVCRRRRLVALCSAGRYAEALSDAEAAESAYADLESEEENARRDMLCGEALLRSERYEEATVVFDAVASVADSLRLNDLNGRCEFARGNVFLARGDHTQAVEHYLRAHELLGDSLTGADTAAMDMNIGLLLMDAGRLRDSLALFKMALSALEPDAEPALRSRIHHNVARSLLGLEKYGSALDQFSVACVCVEEALARTAVDQADREILRASLPDAAVPALLIMLAFSANARRAQRSARVRELHDDARSLVEWAQDPSLLARLSAGVLEPRSGLLRTALEALAAPGDMDREHALFVDGLRSRR